EYEPRVIVAGRPEVLERAERVEPGEERHGQALPGRVEPHARWAGEDADAVPRPHGRVILHALDVVPHPVAVHEPGARPARDLQPTTVDVRRHAAQHVPGGRAEPL